MQDCSCVTVETRYKEIWYNKISDITNSFLRSQWRNFLCFVLFLTTDIINIDDITKQKILVPRISLYRVSPVLHAMNCSIPSIHYIVMWKGNAQLCVNLLSISCLQKLYRPLTFVISVFAAWRLWSHCWSADPLLICCLAGSKGANKSSTKS